ncbi:hypothetical protein OROHE_004507 [Orobanche hederae]
MRDSQPQVFSVRIVSIDYYMASPIPGLDISYSPVHGGKVNEVPVIRIYGSTPGGQKTCLHIHRVLPYLYIPCSDMSPLANYEADSCKHSISLALEKALKDESGEAEMNFYLCSYYPHDVSRAADLLLTGAIMDKTLQPYESHIPFLLQFLIDYNLYGMGHLHVSKVRFRYPVPDVFSQRKVKLQGKLRPLADDSTCMDFQADLGGDLCLNTPIWISSTIPDEWMWRYLPEPGSSTNEDFPRVRRQSASELEVDAVLHDIINQQFISYASLSQSHSEVKMVQSLIPIWEDEYERNGVPEAIPLASEKPLPQDVLRILSDGTEPENRMESRNEAENWSLLTAQSNESSKVCGDLTGSEFANFKNSDDLASKFLKASDRIGSLLSSNSLFQNVDAAGTNDIDAADQLQLSGTMGPSIPKATYEDPLRLLKWFAASQAAEDINSDDELARETILNPLLPSRDIDKVLEMASVDYESESQKECQDILDSVDMLNFEELNDGAFLRAECNSFSKSSSNKIISQVDGSSDDLQSTPCQDKSLKTDRREAEPELKSNLIGKDRLKRPRWGPLPVSCQKVSDDLHPDTYCIWDGRDGERKEGLGISCLGDETKRFSIEKADEQKDVSYMKQASAIVEYSTRDLMRRKRSHRIEHVECRSQAEGWKAELCPDAECRGDINPASKLCNDIEDPDDLPSPMHKPQIQNEDFHVKSTISCFATIGELPLSSSKESVDVESENLLKNENPGLLQTVAVESCTVPSKSAPSDLVSNNNCIRESGCQTSINLCGIPAEYLKGLDGGTAIERSKNSPENVNKEFQTPKLPGMTFSVKPPTIDCIDDPEREVPGNSGSNVGKYLHEDTADNCLPFFVRNCAEELQGNSLRKCKYISNQERVVGVPTIYQNDGSYLFMLTPAVSPPLKDPVDRWLSSDSSDILRQNINVSSPFLPIYAGLPEEVLDSQGSQADDGNYPSSESAFLSKRHPNKRNRSVEVKASNETKNKTPTACSVDTSQISGPEKNTRPTPLSQIGFRDPSRFCQRQQLTLMSIEVQAESRGDLRPDPRFDAINIVVLFIQEDNESLLDTHVLLRCGSVYVAKDLDAVPESRIFVFTEELQLLEHFMKIIFASDPDVLMGWDVQSGSLGFLAERAARLGVCLLNNISRAPLQTNVAPGDSGASEKERGKVYSESVSVEAIHLENTVIEDEWGRTHASGVHVGGRIVLNIWRLMRNEVKLHMYTVEAVAETVLRRKIPHVPWKVLTKWFSSGPGRARYRSIDYTLERAKLNFQIMNQLDMVNRTSELARVFGIDFFSVLSRGSQYRVESMFLRLAHTQNYLAISPGKQQVANQPAMECLPLVMEPKSNFYADPVIVLDFQSLYPSIVIAYNLCFCTCLGKITPPKPNTLGVTSYSPDVNILCNLKSELLVTPNGVVYVPSKVRKGILPRLLEEILSTRIMLKQAMKKLASSQIVLRRILNARQLALKLIANVTYGYTAAGFSGRMPCAELADSIVQCGRRTLEAAISLVNSNDKWKARVVYGDTDSMFVLLKGRSLNEAFTVGREIASAVTEMNPSPVTLKMEKIYFPCFLLTKKRYVGYSYESPDQSKPSFDAKGIETVRRDTCGAVAKMMEQSLRIYFESQNIDKA